MFAEVIGRRPPSSFLPSASAADLATFCMSLKSEPEPAHAELEAFLGHENICLCLEWTMPLLAAQSMWQSGK